MTRRAVIRLSARGRWITRGCAATIFAVALATCIMRFSWIQSGGRSPISIEIEHGVLSIEKNAVSPQPPAAAGPLIFNRQLDPGYSFDLISWHVLARGPAVTTTTTLNGATTTRTGITIICTITNIGVATILGGLALTLLALTLPLSHMPPGQCLCGYDLRGLSPDTHRCPECGETITTA